MIPGFPSRRAFSSLSEQEILALAISSEEEDSRIYATYAERLRIAFPQTAVMFDAMAAEEDTHRRRLIEIHRRRFGETIPLVRREHVAGFYARRPYWLVRTLGLERVRREAMLMEAEARNFYRRAAERTSDAQTRKLLGDLAVAETGHMRAAEQFERTHLGEDEREDEKASEQRLFLLQIVQPGLAGLMDGSVSTLAPLFAAAFATQSTWETFLVGMAASVGAGISMGFAEALSDDGALTGRGSPVIRGFASGIMTTLGGVGHALPYLIPDFTLATTLAIIVVLFELWAIAWVRWKYMDTPFWRAAYQIVFGGSLVFAAGILIGNA
jgi:erythrin-vacuolar iron transport family protein